LPLKRILREPVNKLDDRALLAQWKPSYKRGFIMQAPLAVIGCLLGFAAWWMTGRLAFFGGLLMVASLPWTVFGVMPTNNLLMQTDLMASGPKSRALIH
jgi:anthrone oxygenase-like protein